MKTYSGEKDLQGKLAELSVTRADFKVVGCPGSSDRQPPASLAIGSHPELVYGTAILASTSWNRNDDVFIPSETWASYKSCLHTPFNDQHNKKKIIGHIVDARPVAADMTPIVSDTPPEFFHIEAAFCLYQHSEIHPDIVSKIREEAVAGQTFVSMEATMRDFMYAVLAEDGTIHIIPRDEESSFLTKYLRVFGGSGEYKGMRIGRVLKDFYFTGMGNVSRPANPDSVYTSIAGVSEKPTLILTNIKDFECINHRAAAAASTSNEEKESTMSMTLEQALAKIAELEAKVKTSETENLTKDLKDMTLAYDAVTEKLAQTESKLQVAEKAAEQAKSEANAATERATKAETDLTAAQAKLDQIEAQKTGLARVAEMKGLGMTFEDDAAETAKFAAMSKDQYEAILGYTKKAFAKTQPAAEDAKKNAEKILDTAKADETANVEAAANKGEDENKKAEEAVKATAASIANHLLGSRVKTKKEKKD